MSLRQDRSRYGPTAPAAVNDSGYNTPLQATRHGTSPSADTPKFFASGRLPLQPAWSGGIVREMSPGLRACFGEACELLSMSNDAVDRVAFVVNLAQIYA